MAPEASPGAPVPAPHYDRVGRVFILLCLAVTLLLGWKIFRPFLGAVATAAILDVVFYPFFARLARAWGGRRALAAGATVVIVVICVMLPLAVMVVVFTRQALQLYDFVSAKAQDGTLDQVLKLRDWDTLEAWFAAHAPWLDVRALNVKNLFVAFLQKISALGVGLGSSVVSNVLGTVVSFAVVLFSLFFFLLDGGRFARWLSCFSPLNAQHERRLLDTFIGFTKSAVLGSGLIAVAQGVLGGLAFWMVGLRGILWGFVMAFMSLVPLVGTAVVWVPAGVILIVLGRVGAGLFVLAWGTVVISGVDNVIRLFVVKGPTRLHPLLLFFAILGGIKFAGPLGIVAGPIILATVMTFLEFYRDEFIAQPPPSAEAGP